MLFITSQDGYLYAFGNWIDIKEESKQNDPVYLLINPNISRTSTKIKYQIDNPGYVSVKIFNTLGNEIRTLVDGYVNAGRHMIHWDLKDNQKRRVGSGIYLCRFHDKNRSIQSKIVVLD